MTLTFKLIQAPLKTNLPTRFQVHRSDGSASRVETDRHTDGHTDGTENITSFANAGGKKSKRLTPTHPNKRARTQSACAALFFIRHMLPP